MSLKSQILELYDKTEFNEEDRSLFIEFRTGLNSGEIRAAEKINGNWITNDWVKKGILAGFKMGSIIQLGNFLDKDTYPAQNDHTLVDSTITTNENIILNDNWISTDWFQHTSKL